MPKLGLTDSKIVLLLYKRNRDIAQDVNRSLRLVEKSIERLKRGSGMGRVRLFTQFRHLVDMEEFERYCIENTFNRSCYYE